MRLGRQFSIATMLLVTLVTALLLLNYRSTAQLLRLQRDSQGKIEQLESTAASQRKRLEEEFFGLHGDPILAIHFGRPNGRPHLFRILNSKHAGQRINLHEGVVRKAGDPSGSDAPAARHARIDVRLLRTLDDHDYYRLVLHPTFDLNGGLHPEEAQERTVLFQYDGKPQLLAQTASFVIAIGNSPAASMQALLSSYSAEDAAARKAAWASGGTPTVRTMQYPSARSENDRRPR